MAQVHNRVNAGIMDGVTCCGMMEEDGANSNEYKIGTKEAGPSNYFHVTNENRKTMYVTEEQFRKLKNLIKESSDSVPYFNLRLDDERAIPFITYKRKNGTNTPTFIGEPGEYHEDMTTRLVLNHDINKEDFGDSLLDIKRNENRSGRVWILDDKVVASYYSYQRDNYKAMYDDIVNTLMTVKEKTGADFNIGKVIIDFWTFISNYTVLIPVRWLNNGVADAYFPHMKKCVPADSSFDEDEYVMTTDKGIVKLDWNGDNINEARTATRLNEEKKMPTNYGKYIKSLIEFMREQGLKIDPLPEIELNPEEQDGIFVKTGYYSPDEKKVVVFIDQRHPKDVLRTVAHEFIHHMQNLQDPNKDWGGAGDLEADRKLRGIEGEAFLLGNIIFREWTEKMKRTGELNESRKQRKNDNDEIVPETCDKCGGKVVLQIHGEPVYICKECGKYFGTMPFNLNENVEAEIVEPDDVDLSSFNIKKHLNPKFWDDGHLDTRIRLKLLDIADDFFHSLDVDWVEPEDVIITGSLANYNWNKKYSDIDLHILVDYEDVDERTDFVREYFTMKKNEWNRKHEGLKIFGFPVEVYVQDSNEPHASSGVYSIDRDEWITEPDIKKIRSGKVDKKHVRETISTYMNKIDTLIDIYKKHKDDKYEMKKVSDEASDMLGEIKKMRKDDLQAYGREMCDGNIIFKALRRSDYIGKLIKLRDLTYNKINSL